MLRITSGFYHVSRGIIWQHIKINNMFYILFISFFELFFGDLP